MSDSPVLTLDQRVDAIVNFLFGFQSPENLGRPQINWEMFKIDWETNPPTPKWGGLLRGESLAGIHPDPKVFIWPEVAHLDFAVGDHWGPAGNTYGSALANQRDFLNNLPAVINPNLAVKPSTIMVSKVRTQNRRRTNMLFGTVQSAIADGTTDALANGIIPMHKANDLVCTIGVFIDPNVGAAREKVEDGVNPMLGKVIKDDNGDPVYDTDEKAVALSNHRLYCLNYVCTIAGWYMAMTGGRTPESIITEKAKNPHVLRGFQFAA